MKTAQGDLVLRHLVHPPSTTAQTGVIPPVYPNLTAERIRDILLKELGA